MIFFFLNEIWTLPFRTLQVEGEAERDVFSGVSGGGDGGKTCHFLTVTLLMGLLGAQL